MTTFTPEEQRDNLRKLAEYLLTGKTRMRFTMLIICANEAGHDLRPDQHECGTVGCALGHGPEATGIPALQHETWSKYAIRVFGLDPDGNSDDGLYPDSYESKVWAWCFSGGWYFVDNTPEGAGKRILYYLDRGLPKDWYEQIYEGAPLCY